MPVTRRQALASTALLPLAGAATRAAAQPAAPWPSRPIRMLVAFPAGGPTDTAARIVSQRLAERLGQPVVVDNRAGASGTIGTAALVKSAPDGYTLSMFGMPALVSSMLFPNAGYDPRRDFMPVAGIYDLPMAIVVNPQVLPDVRTLPQLVARARAAKPPMQYTSAGAASFGHLGMELLGERAGFTMQHVAYRGSAPAVAGLLGGEVSAMLADVVAALPHIRAGKLRAIAVGDLKRSVLLPQVPTIAEQGWPGLEISTWGGLIAPNGTPADIATRLASETRALLGEKDVQERLQGAGAIAAWHGPAQMAERLRADYERWGKVLRDKQITAQ